MGLLELQARVADNLPHASSWASAVGGGEGAPLLAIGDVPVEDVLPDFEAFLEGVTQIGTEVTTASALALLEAGAGARAEALRAASAFPTGTGRITNEAPGPIDGLRAPAGFQARAFLEPVYTTLARALGPGTPRKKSRRCFVCGAPPQVSTLRDLPDALGARTSRVRCAGRSGAFRV